MAQTAHLFCSVFTSSRRQRKHQYRWNWISLAKLKQVRCIYLLHSSAQLWSDEGSQSNLEKEVPHAAPFVPLSAHLRSTETHNDEQDDCERIPLDWCCPWLCFAWAKGGGGWGTKKTDFLPKLGDICVKPTICASLLSIFSPCGGFSSARVSKLSSALSAVFFFLPADIKINVLVPDKARKGVSKTRGSSCLLDPASDISWTISVQGTDFRCHRLNKDLHWNLILSSPTVSSSVVITPWEVPVPHECVWWPDTDGAGGVRFCFF